MLASFVFEINTLTGLCGVFLKYFRGLCLAVLYKARRLLPVLRHPPGAASVWAVPPTEISPIFPPPFYLESTERLCVSSPSALGSTASRGCGKKSLCTQKRARFGLSGGGWRPPASGQSVPAASRNLRRPVLPQEVAAESNAALADVTRKAVPASPDCGFSWLVKSDGDPLADRSPGILVLV